MIIARLCDNCQDEYQADTKYLNRNQGRFCSISCSTKYRYAHTPPKADNVICSYCNVGFYLKPSQLKNSKSGHYFCCRAHKDIAQRIGGIKEIMPPHFGTAEIPDYREIAKRHHEQVCNSCGWCEYPEILEVNHIDVNRKNNDPSNLEFLCPTCHAVFHFTTRTGKWRVRA